MLFPAWSSIFCVVITIPMYVSILLRERRLSYLYIYMKTIKLKQGLNIEISGKAALEMGSYKSPDTIAIVPDDFNGIIPKVAVKAGDVVKAGSVLLYDKNHPEIKIVSPVSGTVAEVARGDRRKLLYVSVKADATVEQAELPKADLNSDRETLLAALLEAGFGALIRQRPYDIVALPSNEPKAIYVSAFDSAPLAPDYNFVLKGRELDLQAGLTALSKLTTGKVYYSVSPETGAALRNMQNVEVTEFVGAHPAGNVGVQMNHLQPVNKGEVVWTMNVQDVAMMGRYINSGVLDLSRTIAVAGPEVTNPVYVKAVSGTPIENIMKGNVERGISLRFVNGNLLSGIQTSLEGFLSPFAAQISVVAEGDHADELMGWAAPRFKMFSMSRLYCTKFIQLICPKSQFKFDARVLGGERAFIMSGEYDKVLLMDIMPEQLIKAMIAKNIDKMEQLGAYEVAPEDFALCEYVCTSKIEVQRIVRESLDYLKKELE